MRNWNIAILFIFLAGFCLYFVPSYVVYIIEPGKACEVNVSVGDINSYLAHMAPCNKLTDVNYILLPEGNELFKNMIWHGAILNSFLSGISYIILWLFWSLISYKIYKEKISLAKWGGVFSLFYMVLFIYPFLNAPHLLGYLPFIKINGILELNVGLFAILPMGLFIFYTFLRKNLKVTRSKISLILHSIVLTICAVSLIKLKSILLLIWFPIFINLLSISNVLQILILTLLFMIIYILSFLAAVLLVKIFTYFLRKNVLSKFQNTVLIILSGLIMSISTSLLVILYFPSLYGNNALLSLLITILFSIPLFFDTIILAILTYYVYKKTKANPYVILK